MESDRFDHWTKVLARRMSRRNAGAAMATVAVAAVAHNTASAEACDPVTRCKLNNGICTDVGPLPGGPYPQRWVWEPIPGCNIDGPNDLPAICNSRYADCSKWGCVPGTDKWAIGCR